MAAIRRLAQQIAERFQPDEIILFDSYAYGELNEHSDVDLLVVMPARDEISQEGERGENGDMGENGGKNGDMRKNGERKNGERGRTGTEEERGQEERGHASILARSKISRHARSGVVAAVETLPTPSSLAPGPFTAPVAPEASVRVVGSGGSGRASAEATPLRSASAGSGLRGWKRAAARLETDAVSSETTASPLPSSAVKCPG